MVAVWSDSEMTESQRNIYEEVVKKCGIEHQLIICIEELSELQKEICKYLRTGEHLQELAEEMADVEICLDQIQLYFHLCKEVQKQKAGKLIRLEERLKAGRDL
jgi:hypothetical protein